VRGWPNITGPAEIGHHPVRFIARLQLAPKRQNCAGISRRAPRKPAGQPLRVA